MGPFEDENREENRANLGGSGNPGQAKGWLA
jgi:hypothetical protein